MKRIELAVVGTVQGVGFRPFVRREAIARGLSGRVRNSPRGVEIEAQGEPAALDAFVRAVIAGPEGHAAAIDRIAGHVVEHVERFDDRPLDAGGEVTIVASEHALSAPARASLPPDLAPCAACRAEIAGAGRRRRYAFTSCTRCGPRGSIALRAPWDRANTTMA